MMAEEKNRPNATPISNPNPSEREGSRPPYRDRETTAPRGETPRKRLKAPALTSRKPSKDQSEAV